MKEKEQSIDVEQAARQSSFYCNKQWEAADGSSSVVIDVGVVLKNKLHLSSSSRPDEPADGVASGHPELAGAPNDAPLHPRLRQHRPAQDGEAAPVVLSGGEHEV